MTTETPTPLTYRAMHMLTELYPPRIKGRPPFWRPRRVPVTDVLLPAWDWTLTTPPDREQIAPPILAQLGEPDHPVTMDVNAAYLAAASSVVLGHSALRQGWSGLAFKTPGYYLIDTHTWPDRRMPSPLGTQHVQGDRMWVAHPTAMLLDELSTGGHWPKVVVHDAWTAATSCRLRSWTEHVRDDRLAALRDRRASGTYRWGDYDAYEAVKDGYSIAVQTLRGPAPGKEAKSPVLRPDWYDGIHAQHAASLWRKCWATYRCGHGPIRITATDEVTWTAYDLAELRLRSVPVIRIDPAGEVLGAFKVKGGAPC